MTPSARARTGHGFRKLDVACSYPRAEVLLVIPSRGDVYQARETEPTA